MSYQKHNFTPGAVLLASQLNEMDNEIEILSQGGSGGTVLSDDFKEALLNCFENVAWINENGQTYYDALYDSLYPDNMWFITNILTGCITSNNATNILKNNSYVATITANEGYTLDGATVSINMGGNNVTNLYYSSGSINIPNVTGDLVITVTAISAVTSITAVFTQGSAVIYDTDSLDTLKQYLTVTATYADSTTATVTDYTLSGTLTVGTSTITVSYGGKSDTFTVTVTQGATNTTAQIATENYVLAHQNEEPNYYNYSQTNGGITVLYDMDEATTVLYPAGIIPTEGTVLRSAPAVLVIYDANGNPVDYVQEAQENSFYRWAQDVFSTMSEYRYKWTVSTYSKIAFSLDTRYLNDAYMYDYPTGKIWFAGRNTPYYGKSYFFGNPPYSLPDINSSASSVNVQVTNGNHISAVTSANSRTMFLYPDGTARTTFETYHTNWFKIHTGDVISISVKNLTFTDSGANDNHLFCSLSSNSDGTALYSAGQVDFGIGTGTISDVTLSNTVTDDAVIGCLKLSVYRSTMVEFDYEVSINGNPYIVGTASNA